MAVRRSRPIAPGHLLRASLIQILFRVRATPEARRRHDTATGRRRAFGTTRHLMEQMQYDLMFRWFVGWFVGLGIDDPVWVPTVPGCPGCWQHAPAGRGERRPTTATKQDAGAISGGTKRTPSKVSDYFSGLLERVAFHWIQTFTLQPEAAFALANAFGLQREFD